MANYYRNGTPIYSATAGLGIITTTKFGTTQSKYLNLGLEAIPNNPSYASDFNGTSGALIIETPTTLNYSIGGVDMSSSSIAYWTSGTSSAGAITIPSWATKIRAVLVGAGGTGGASTQQQTVNQAAVDTVQNQNHNHNRDAFGNDRVDNQRNQNDNLGFNGGGNNNFDSNQHQQQGNTQHQRDNHQHNNNIHTPAVTQNISQNGGGGGGGGFIYLSDFTLSPLQIQMQAGATGATVLTIGAGQNVFTAGAGGNGSGATVGSGGTVQTTPSTGATTTPIVGSAGSGITGGQSGIITYSTSITNGNGGNGGAASSTAQNNGSSGLSGYYRIYFLTN